MMDNIVLLAHNISMLEIQKKDGFKDEKIIVLPTKSFASYLENPLVSMMYITDIGFFPEAKYHYREREMGVDEFILIYCTNGKGTIELSDVKIELHRNELFCIPKHTKHKYYANKDDPWSILWVHFNGKNVAYFPLIDKQVVKLDSPKANDRLYFLFNLLIETLESNYTLGNFIYISQLLSLILSEIYFKEKISDIDNQNLYLTKAIRFMYNNLEKELTLEEIADYMKLSKSYLHSIFKKSTQHSPIDFFIHLKMQQACKYLKRSDFLVYEVSEKVGYKDQFYFSRIFKKIIGVSPTEYKKSLNYTLID